MNFTANFSLKSSLFPAQDKVQYRRRKILELRSQGFTNVEISHKLRYCLSTIEKDVQTLRENSQYEYKESIQTNHLENKISKVNQGNSIKILSQIEKSRYTSV